MRLIVGLSGASGIIYGIRLLEVLRDLPQVETHLVISRGAKLTLACETDWPLNAVQGLADVVHSNGNLAASISSGSFPVDGMVIAPCSMKTLSGIVHAYGDSLLIRAADVTLKERRPLVLMPRETPLHLGHTQFFQAAVQLGAILFPPMPAFYTRPRTLEDLIDQTVGRVLGFFDLPNTLMTPWEGIAQPE